MDSSLVNRIIHGDCIEVMKTFPDECIDLTVTSPPYTESDALKYGNPMISRNKVVKECVKILEKDGYLLWLDMTLPMYRKEELLRCISIGIERSTNHRFRQLVGWKKL